jgi:hypothetical protein
MVFEISKWLQVENFFDLYIFKFWIENICLANFNVRNNNVREFSMANERAEIWGYLWLWLVVDSFETQFTIENIFYSNLLLYSKILLWWVWNLELSLEFKNGFKRYFAVKSK